MTYAENELDRIITARDAVEHRFCVRGQRRLWAAYGGDVTFEDFVRHGVTARWLLATNNPYAVALVNKVLNKDEHG